MLVYFVCGNDVQDTENKNKRGKKQGTFSCYHNSMSTESQCAQLAENGINT